MCSSINQSNGGTCVKLHGLAVVLEGGFRGIGGVEQETGECCFLWGLRLGYSSCACSSTLDPLDLNRSNE